VATLFTKAQPTAGLMSYWSLNGNYTNSGPYAINGTNSGSTATTSLQGVANAAMNYSNPTSSVVQYAYHTPNANINFGASQDFSVDLSVYVASPYIHAGGFYDNGINYGGYGIWFWNASGFLQIQFNFKNGSVGTTNGSLAYNTWYHICCLHSANTLKIYINGVLNNSAPASTTAPSYSFNARFGTMYYSAFSPAEYNGHNGKLDEFRIYNRALTQAEITQLSNIALPVKLSWFTAALNKNNVLLNWQTQYEQNSSHFNIQRSTDGINFTDEGRVTAAGNSSTIKNYTYNEILSPTWLMQKTIFYRLQQVDADGKFSYSQVVAVHLNKQELELFVSPNPAKDILQIQTGNSIAGTAAIAIIDAKGTTVYYKQLTLQQGSNNIPINISALANATYTVKLANSNSIYTKQFIKQ
jgi:hypothetical protein